MIKLTQPLIAWDSETTGTSVSQDRIVSLACKKFHVDGTVTIHNTLINPGVPIPASATEVHKITDEMVADKPTFKQIAKSVYALFEGCSILTYNGNDFDKIILAEEFAREGIIWPASNMKSIDACTIFKKKEERNLTAAVKFYTGEIMEDANDALADTEATIKVFEGQLSHYEDIGAMTLDELHEYCIYDRDKGNIDLAGKIKRNDDGDFVFTFGKNKDKRV